MKTLFFILFTLTSIFLQAEHDININIFYEDTENGCKIFIDNKEHCPVSVKLDLVMTNLESSMGNNQIFVIPANSKKELLTELKIKKAGKPFKWSYSYLVNYGNHNQSTYDSEYEYFLPYKKSETYEIYQGYNGTFSHKNENSLDFSMPIGTEIIAIRGGIVIDMIQENSKNCPKEICKKYNNYILVYHSDGTFAEYAHIKKNGSKVKIGEKINQGQIIGYSGNVGWSSGPHLHLVVFLQKLNERKTLETKFLTEGGEKSEYLKEKKKYSRNY